MSQLRALKGSYADPNADTNDEVLFAFAVIENRTITGNNKDYRKWLEDTRPNHEITIE